MEEGLPPLLEKRELDSDDRERAYRLLGETNAMTTWYNTYDKETQNLLLTAYNAVLLKDIRWSLFELLNYKQREGYG